MNIFKANLFPLNVNLILVTSAPSFFFPDTLYNINYTIFGHLRFLNWKRRPFTRRNITDCYCCMFTYSGACIHKSTSYQHMHFYKSAGIFSPVSFVKLRPTSLAIGYRQTKQNQSDKGCQPMQMVASTANTCTPRAIRPLSLPLVTRYSAE